ncbi:MAG TPA: chemotaxis protein CheW [Streptosporangiaceae bacterium]
MSTYVQFRVAGEAYAIPAGHVVEVAPPAELTRVPGTPPELAGVRNMRGTILPVIDLAALLGIARSTPPGRVLVAETGEHRAGFEIDDVDAVRVLAEPDAETESPLLTGARLDGGQLIGFLDIPRVFAELHRSAS